MFTHWWGGERKGKKTGSKLHVFVTPYPFPFEPPGGSSFPVSGVKIATEFYFYKRVSPPLVPSWLV